MTLDEDICHVCKSHFDSEFCPFCGTRRQQASPS
jgi:rRNA maturation endonuclease Nob1